MKYLEVRNAHELELVRQGLVREQRQQEKCLKRDIEPYKQVFTTTTNMLSGVAGSVKDLTVRYSSVWKWVGLAGRLIKKIFVK